MSWMPNACSERSIVGIWLRERYTSSERYTSGEKCSTSSDFRELAL